MSKAKSIQLFQHKDSTKSFTMIIHKINTLSSFYSYLDFHLKTPGQNAYKTKKKYFFIKLIDNFYFFFLKQISFKK